ncbi:hypothetical protein, partial [Shewanella algae]|uniref:hypothetical protein n=1 Tax=Shewanella algae TaxID=38313 RepID=UPI001C62CF42
YTAGDAVIEGGVLKTDLSISWPRHGILSFSKAPFKPRQGERNLPRIMGVFILSLRIMGVFILSDRKKIKLLFYSGWLDFSNLRVLKSTTGA